MTIRSRAVFAFFALLVVGALGAGTLAAQGVARGGRGQRMGPGGGPGAFGLFQRLDLTDAQKEQVRAIVRERPARSSRQALETLRRDLRAAIMADTPDTAKIEQLKASIAEAEATALNEEVDVQLRIAQILTPEQRQKARELPAGPRGRGF
jgi:Spy/CpxP family protein refolding chaperone